MKSQHLKKATRKNHENTKEKLRGSENHSPRFLRQEKAANVTVVGVIYSGPAGMGGPLEGKVKQGYVVCGPGRGCTGKGKATNEHRKNKNQPKRGNRLTSNYQRKKTVQRKVKEAAEKVSSKKTTRRQPTDHGEKNSPKEMSYGKKKKGVVETKSKKVT